MRYTLSVVCMRRKHVVRLHAKGGVEGRISVHVSVSVFGVMAVY